MLATATPTANWVVILPVILSLIAGAVLLILRGRNVSRSGLAIIAVLLVGAADLALLLRVLNSGPLSMTMGRWLPPFGISFTADAAGAAFALAAAFVTLIVLVYAEMDRTARHQSFHALALLLLAGVSGSFLTGDLFNLYVWFEVMLIASFGLLILDGSPLALDGAVKYGFLNFIATTLFLAGLGLLYGTLGTLNMADIVGAAAKANPAVITSIAALFLLAFGIKAAAFPVNAWLPASYHTPSAAVSALLAGLLTKVGVYALLRTLILLLPASRDLLQPVLVAIAAATLLLAPLGAIAETNLRRAIGFLMIGGIGAAIAGIALPAAIGVAGSVTYIANAMLTISALYLVAGLVEKLTGETDTRRMGGVYAANSAVSILFLLLVFSISGVPLFLGFWPKLLLLQAAIERSALAGAGPHAADFAGLGIAICLLLNALLTLIAGTRLWSHIFWRAGPEGALSEHAAIALTPLSRGERLFGIGAAATLTALILAAGLWPAPLLDIGRAAASSLLAPQPYIAAVGLGAPS
jgi:multicomponent Na+:H+ antiporter subunit D